MLQRTGERRDEFDPIPVYAEIPFLVTYTKTVRTEARVVAWTDKAVLVEFDPGKGAAPRQVWIWASAVTRKYPRRRR